jgi:hypothetical protein
MKVRSNEGTDLVFLQDRGHIKIVFERDGVEQDDGAEFYLSPAEADKFIIDYENEQACTIEHNVGIGEARKLTYRERRIQILYTCPKGKNSTQRDRAFNLKQENLIELLRGLKSYIEQNSPT